MKKINLLFTFLILALSFTSCEKEDNKLTGTENVGGLISVAKTSVAYVIGDGTSLPYANMFSVNQSAAVKVDRVNIYKSFTNISGVRSNEILLRTVPISTANQHIDLPFSVSYLQLIAGLTVAGTPMSTNDTTLNIGDTFTLRYEQVRTDGVVVGSDFTTKISVGTRLAGTYKCNVGIYYRIGVLTASTADWPSETIIESVDATTYRVVSRFGYFPPAANDDNTWYFKVNGNVITYSSTEPDGAAQTGNGQPFITCTSNPASFLPQVNCGTSNVVILDNVNGGKDVLKMTFGYLSPSGPRVFYQELEKIVN